MPLSQTFRLGRAIILCVTGNAVGCRDSTGSPPLVWRPDPCATGRSSRGGALIARAHRSKGFLRVYCEVPAAIDALHTRSEEHTSELQSHSDIVCRLLL